VELLVVIAIIAVLAGASYPAIMGAIKSAKITEGNKQAKDIVVAIEGFEQKYDYLPYAGSIGAGVTEYSDTTNLTELLKVLMGKESTPDINPNNLQFFDYQAASNGVNGIIFDADGETPSKLKDPFGNDFTVYIDYSGENSFDLSSTVFNGHKDKDGSSLTVRATSAIAVSPGPDREFYDPSNSDLDEDDVKSW